MCCRPKRKRGAGAPSSAAVPARILLMLTKQGANGLNLTEAQVGFVGVGSQ